MNVVIFGASGMIGQGVLRECELAPDVERILLVGRSPSGVTHPKVRELVCSDLFDLAPIEHELAGYDACFFCLGVSSGGMTEEAYRRMTYDLTLAAAKALLRQNPGLTFVYVSGASTDSTGQSRTMWARVKGETENALLAMPFKAAFMFRPGYIQPMHGEISRTPSYRWMYRFAAPLYPLWRLLFRRYVSTTEEIGRAMLRVARAGAPKRVLESADLVALAASAPGTAQVA